MDYNQLISSLLSSSNQLYSIAADREKAKQAQRESALARSQQQQQFQQQMQAQQDRYNQQSALAQAQTAEEQRRYDEGGALRQSELQQSLLGQKSLGLDVESKGMDLSKKKQIEGISSLADQPDKYLESLRSIDSVLAMQYEQAKESVLGTKLDNDEKSQKMALAKLVTSGPILSNLVSLDEKSLKEYVGDPGNKAILEGLGLSKSFDFTNKQHLAAGLTVAGEAAKAIKTNPSLMKKYLNEETFTELNNQFSLAKSKAIKEAMPEKLSAELQRAVNNSKQGMRAGRGALSGIFDEKGEPKHNWFGRGWSGLIQDPEFQKSNQDAYDTLYFAIRNESGGAVTGDKGGSLMTALGILPGDGDSEIKTRIKDLMPTLWKNPEVLKDNLMKAMRGFDNWISRDPEYSGDLNEYLKSSSGLEKEFAKYRLQPEQSKQPGRLDRLSVAEKRRNELNTIRFR